MINASVKTHDTAYNKTWWAIEQACDSFVKIVCLSNTFDALGNIIDDATWSATYISVEDIIENHSDTKTIIEVYQNTHDTVRESIFHVTRMLIDHVREI